MAPETYRDKIKEILYFTWTQNYHNNIVYDDLKDLDFNIQYYYTDFNWYLKFLSSNNLI